MYLTILDFDDTLFCTTHVLRQPDGSVQLTELSQTIRDILLFAKTYGNVFIVTNADLNWVEKCVDSLELSCKDSFVGVHVFSTINTGIAELYSPEDRKTIAFRKLAGIFTSRGAMHHLICIGDSIYDRKASIVLRNQIHSVCFVKNVKLLNEPTLTELLLQHFIILANIKDLYEIEKHTDCYTDCSSKSISSYE